MTVEESRRAVEVPEVNDDGHDWSVDRSRPVHVRGIPDRVEIPVAVRVPDGIETGREEMPVEVGQRVDAEDAVARVPLPVQVTVGRDHGRLTVGPGQRSRRDLVAFLGSCATCDAGDKNQRDP